MKMKRAGTLHPGPCTLNPICKSSQSQIFYYGYNKTVILNVNKIKLRIHFRQTVCTFQSTLSLITVFSNNIVHKRYKVRTSVNQPVVLEASTMPFSQMQDALLYWCRPHTYDSGSCCRSTNLQINKSN